MKKKKQFISLILSLVFVLSVACTCCYNNVDVYAEGDETTVDKYGVEEAFCNDSLDSSDDYYNLFYASNDSLYITFNNMIINNTLPSFTFYPSGRNENWLNYVFWTSSNLGEFTSCPDTSFILTNGINWYLLTEQYEWRYGNGGDFWNDTHYSYNPSSSSWSEINGPRINDKNTGKSIDGVSYITQEVSGGMKFLSTDLPIYYFEGSTLPDTLNGLEEITGSLGASSVEEHNTLMSGSGIYLNNSDCNTGQVYIIAKTDNSQANDSTLKLRFWCSCNYVIKMGSTLTGTGKSMQTLLRGYGFDAGYGSTNNVSGTYFYQDYTYKEFSMSDFSSGMVTLDLNTDINQKLKHNSKSISSLAQKISSGSNWVENAADGIVAQAANITNSSVSGQVGPINIKAVNKKLNGMLTDEYTIENISYTFNIALYRDGVSVGQISQPYILASSTGTTGRGDTSDTLTGSDEEYYEAGTKNQSSGSYNNDYAPSSEIDVTSTGGGSSSSSSSPSSSTVNITGDGESSGGITINNNNNNYAYGGSSESSGFGSFLSTVISLLSNGQTTSSDTILSMTDANGFMDVANTGLSAVPSSLWTVLLTTFSVCVGITIVAVVLGLLLKIFT